MSVSSRSRASSLFSLDSRASSFTSNPPSPRSSFDEKHAMTEKAKPTVTKPLVLQWKPQLLSTAFTQQISTHVKFTAFPPRDYKSSLPRFDHLSRKTAISLLHDETNPISLSIFASLDSIVTPVTSIPIPSNLPTALIDQLLNGAEWELYVISESVPAPVGINIITASHEHYVAFKRLQNGVERYIFGPAGLVIHSSCRLVDIGRLFDDSVTPETLSIEEHLEVLCNKFMKRFYVNTIKTWTEETHELLRVHWDRAMSREWAIREQTRQVDLLA